MYIGERTVKNFRNYLFEFSNVFRYKKLTKEIVNDFIATCNSYLGFMSHYSSFKVRKRLLQNFPLRQIFATLYTNQKLTKLIPFHEYSFYNKGISIEGIIETKMYYACIPYVMI